MALNFIPHVRTFGGGGEGDGVGKMCLGVEQTRLSLVQ